MLRYCLFYTLVFVSVVQVSAIRLPKFDLGSVDKQRIQLDLSGRWRTHLIGSRKSLNLEDQSSNTITTSITNRPLVEVDDLPLSLFVAVDFDLNQRLGPLKWLTTLQWLPQNTPWMSATIERDMVQGKMAVQVETSTHHKAFSCQTRYADEEPTQILLKFIPHRRLQTECLLINTPSLQMPSATTRENAMNPNWWIPNVSVTSLGRLNSNWCTSIPWNDHCRSHNVQLRLKVRRNLGWGFLSRAVVDDNSSETWCSLQVQDTYHPMYSTMATMSGQLENLSSSWGLCIRQTMASHKWWPSYLQIEKLK